MKREALEIGTALVLAFVLGQFGVAPIIFLFIGIRAIMSMIIWWRHGESILRQVRRILRFLIHFVLDMVRSNVVLAVDVLTPQDMHKVRIVEVPLDGLSNAEVAMLIHRITLTPGTLPCDLIKNRTRLIVHVMYGANEGLAKALRLPVDLLRKENV